MKVFQIDLPSAGSGPGRRLSRFLIEGWTWGIQTGAIEYDPDDVETLTIPPIRFYLLPGREARPRTLSDQDLSIGLGRPHGSCPFDTQDFLDEREILRVAREGRAYHITLNRFPVLRHHFLAVRPVTDSPDTLPQRLIGAAEIEDMLYLAEELAHPYRLFFNSNQGADGSRSGSSVNHWHFQIFPSQWTAAARSPGIQKVAGEVEIGQIPDWPARHRLYRSRNKGPLSAAIWSDVERINQRNIAYNLEISPRENGDLLSLLFPRAPLEDIRLPTGSVLTGDFGGFELTGSVVVPAREIFEWIRAHPREALDRILERMHRGTSWPIS